MPNSQQTTQEGKRRAAEAALDEVSSGSTLGLGTGSTVRYLLEALGRALDEGRLTGISGVPTSLDTEARCRSLGIPLLALPEAGRLDVAVDGADEVDPELELIKGLGGALVREKMVVQAADRFVVIADDSKAVGRLGERSPLPVEVVPFGWQVHLGFFESLGAEPVPRMTSDGALFVSDNGNHIVDLRFPEGIADPDRLNALLAARAGVLDSGLFLGVADRVLLGSASGVEEFVRSGAAP